MRRSSRLQSMTGRRPHSRDVAERLSLRDRYTKGLSRIVETLDSNPQVAYSRDSLKDLNVILESFDPDDQGFIDSKACLFTPLPLDVRSKFSLRDPEESNGGSWIVREFDELLNASTGLKNPPPDLVLQYRARDILYYLDLLYESSIRRKGKDVEYLCVFSHWDEMKHDNTFLNGLMDMTAGDGPKHPCWSTERTREWRADCEDPETTRPHVMLVICTGVEAKESELLFAELGPIAQAIQCRFAQKEFENTSLFPVLAISLFGPRHGRLLQARLTPSGNLKVRASPIHNFTKKNSAPFDLYLRYLACEPRDGEAYEFFSDEEDTSTRAAVKRGPPSDAQPPPSPKVKRIRLTKGEEDSSHGSDKENRGPERGTPSSEGP